MSFIPLPMDVDRPVLWLVSLLAITAVGVGLGIGWSAAQVSAVEIQVQDGDDDGPLTVALARSENGSFRQVEQTTLNATDAEDRRVSWTVSDPGWYRLRLTGEGRECEYRVSVQPTDDGVVGEAPPSTGEDCPGVRVQVRNAEQPFWQVGGE
jgi:hypothetical protein